ncbi:hypothetical protein [uncultured Roseovarius sp.]|uniref:hypothetical protein n=1 Tax=uncultured Roseovarius sp. TaxID=293344 RepID=UPI00261DD1E2|nr:hypothetical protein [uncultured Roseovarius sp.]
MEALQSLIQTLPDVAGSPLALVAYLATVSAVIFFWSRSARIKLLLSKLEKVPESDVADLIKHEMGAILPENISADEWLKSRRQSYYFYATLSILFVVIVVLALGIFRISALPESQVSLLRPSNSSTVYEKFDVIWEPAVPAIVRLLSAGAVVYETGEFVSTPHSVSGVPNSLPKACDVDLKKASYKLAVSPRYGDSIFAEIEVRQDPRRKPIGNVPWIDLSDDESALEVNLQLPLDYSIDACIRIEADGSIVQPVFGRASPLGCKPPKRPGHEQLCTFSVLHEKLSKGTEINLSLKGYVLSSDGNQSFIDESTRMILGREDLFYSIQIAIGQTGVAQVEPVPG